MLETRGQAKAQLQQIHALAAQARFASDMPRIRPHPVREHARGVSVRETGNANTGMITSASRWSSSSARWMLELF